MSLPSITNSIAEKLKSMMPCDDGSPCCCIPERGTVISISVINFFGCVVDLAATEECMCMACDVRFMLSTARKLLVTLFQAANLILLFASVFENAMLVDIYVWYTLAYIVMGFVAAIYEFVVKAKHQGARSLITFVPEVAFLFVVYRCLPLVDLYRRHLYSVNAISRK